MLERCSVEVGGEVGGEGGDDGGVKVEWLFLGC